MSHASGLQDVKETEKVTLSVDFWLFLAKNPARTGRRVKFELIAFC